MIIRVRVNHELTDLEVNPSDIVVFDVSNRIDRTNKGSFKRFLPSYRVQVGSESYITTESQIKALKEELKGLYEMRKYPVIEYKNFTERKAIDYTYRMNSI